MRPPLWYVAVVGLNAAIRLRELAISRANERATGGVPAAPRTYPLMIAAHVGLVALPLLEVAGHPERRPRWGWVAVLVSASALRVWCIRSLGPMWNVRASVPSNLTPVTTGPYRYVRHPNYVAVILEFLALPLVAGAWISAAVLSAVNAVVLADRIRAEERLLDASPAYRAAFANKARFIPGLY
jgi:methyltransferase